MPVDLIRSPDLAATVPYAYASVVTAGSLVFTAGACPLDADGRIGPPDDVPGQAVRVMENLVTALAETMRVFFEQYDVLVLPVSQVPPFPADQEFPTAINGRPMESYLDWMRSAYFITVTGCPAISVPAGFTPEGWPVGIQVVAAPRAERRLLEVAHAYERLTRVGERRPQL